MSAGRKKIPLRYNGTTQTVTYTGTAGRTAAGVGANTKAVRIVVTTAAFIVFGGSTVDATTSDIYLAAAREENFTISPGQYVSAIQSAAGGSMYVSEME